jgi:transposase-like protein
MKFERSRMAKDDVLFGYRLQVFDLASRSSVSHACRVFGIHRSTYYAWKDQVERGGLTPACDANSTPTSTTTTSTASTTAD